MKLNAKTFVLMLGCTALLTACGEKPEDRQIAAGLACVDGAQTASDASTCLDKVSGLTSQKSYLIRCSANFIAQGLTGKRLTDAFQNMSKNQSNTSQPTTTLMAYMVFRTDGEFAKHTADITFNNCSSSGVAGLIGIASIAKTASTVMSLTGGITPGSNLDPTSPTFDPNQLKARLQAAASANDPATNTTIGTLAQTAQQVYCGSGSNFSTQDICTKLNSAITAGGGSAPTIGAQLLALLAQ